MCQCPSPFIHQGEYAYSVHHSPILLFHQYQRQCALSDALSEGTHKFTWITILLVLCTAIRMGTDASETAIFLPVRQCRGQNMSEKSKTKVSDR